MPSPKNSETIPDIVYLFSVSISSFRFNALEWMITWGLKIANARSTNFNFRFLKEMYSVYKIVFLVLQICDVLFLVCLIY